MATNAPWPQDVFDFAVEMWGEGHSAREVSNAIWSRFRLKKSRNSVIGIVHRNGLQRANPHKRVAAKTKRERKRLTPAQRHLFQPNPPRKQSTAALPDELELIRAMPPLDPTLGVAALTDHQCRFPIGDPLEPGFAFCGRMATCAPYCADHARLTYQPGAKRPAPDALEKLARTADRRRMREAMAVLG